MSASLNMRTTRLSPFRPHQLKLAAVLLCALATGDVLAQAASAAKSAAPAAAKQAVKPSTGFLPPASSNAHVIDSVYVIVNDEVITKREVDQRMAEIAQRLKAQGAQMPAE
jgi:peptidyl-prolyl cis-trans isomerase SurA